MPNDETHPETETGNNAVKALIERIERHEDEGSDIRAAAEKLGLDAKGIKTIRKAKADAAAAQKTLDALMGAGLASGGVAELLSPTGRAPRAPRKPEGDDKALSDE